MSQKHKSTAPITGTWVSPSPEGMPLPDGLKERPARPFVVNADNKAAPAQMLVVVLLFDVFLGFTIFLGMHYLGERSAFASFVVALIASGMVAMIALLSMSGDMPALLEAWLAERNEKRRIQAVENIGLGWVGVAEIHAQAQLTDAQARLLESQTNRERLALALADKPAAQRVANRLETFTEPEAPPDTLRDDMLTWLGDVLDHVDSEGRITVAVPWSKNGSLSAGDKARVLEWISVVNQAAPAWVLRRDYAWWVNTEKYQTGAAIVEQFAKWPMTRPK